MIINMYGSRTVVFEIPRFCRFAQQDDLWLFLCGSVGKIVWEADTCRKGKLGIRHSKLILRAKTAVYLVTGEAQVMCCFVVVFEQKEV